MKPSAAMLSPFGLESKKIVSLATSDVAKMYVKMRAGRHSALSGCARHRSVRVYTHGLPFLAAGAGSGEESFYLELSQAWSEYYRSSRWEYEHALRHCGSSDRLLEIGCGDCHFLRLVEPRVREAVGLELNRAAVGRKSVAARVLVQTIEDFAPAARETFDVVCTFQVLEHVINPRSFLENALACLKPGGRLLVSTRISRTGRSPNNAIPSIYHRTTWDTSLRRSI